MRTIHVSREKESTQFWKGEHTVLKRRENESTRVLGPISCTRWLKILRVFSPSDRGHVSRGLYADGPQVCLGTRCRDNWVVWLETLWAKLRKRVWSRHCFFLQVRFHRCFTCLVKIALLNAYGRKLSESFDGFLVSVVEMVKPVCISSWLWL